MGQCFSNAIWDDIQTANVGPIPTTQPTKHHTDLQRWPDIYISDIGPMLTQYNIDINIKTFSDIDYDYRGVEWSLYCQLLYRPTIRIVPAWHCARTYMQIFIRTIVIVLVNMKYRLWLQKDRHVGLDFQNALAFADNQCLIDVGYSTMPKLTRSYAVMLCCHSHTTVLRYLFT